MTNTKTQAAELDALRDRALQLLELEKRPVHTGELALRLGVPAHRLLTALHHAERRGQLWFTSSEGWKLAQHERERGGHDRQARLV